MRAERRLRALGLLLLAAIVVGACSGGSDDQDEAGPSTTESTSASASTEPDPSAPATTEPPTTQPTTAPPTTEPAPTEPPTTEPLVDPIVFADDFGTSIAPVLASRCASCHTEGGPGSVHWPLSTAADAAAFPALMATNIETGAMPPWPAGDESVAFHDDRSLRPDELAAILAWIEAGAALDVAADTPIEPTADFLNLPRVDHDLGPEEPYQRQGPAVDDYRCLVYDPGFDRPTWVTGYQFVPDQTEVVHHAIGYLVPADQRDRVASLAGDDPGGGYECFGGSRVRGDRWFMGWAPGQGPTLYPDGSGLLVEPGDLFVVQIHYHFEIAAPPDASRVELMTTDGDAADLDEIEITQYVAPAEIPCSTNESGPLCDRAAAKADAIDRFGAEGVQADGINLLCGVRPDDFAAMTDGIASSSCTLPVYGFGQVVSVLGHEHEIGRSFRMTLNPGRDDERVLLDIPEWDFDWQYNYEPAEAIVLVPGDTLRIECSWDRSLRDPSLEPRYILWADGTNDEMCFSTVVTRDLG